MTLTVTDLTIARGGLPVLAGLSFAVSKGQALILRGPNGAGKTTLLRTIAGLQAALSVRSLGRMIRSLMRAMRMASRRC